MKNVKFGAIYPSVKAVAYRIERKRGWKLGDPVNRIRLGELFFDEDDSVEHIEMQIKMKFREADSFRAWDTLGHWFVAGAVF